MQSIPHLHAIRDEDAPPYDGKPPRVVRHFTMIDDDAVEAVAATCGLTGLGLYAMLERRVNKDGQWTTSIPALAATFGCSPRHIRDTCKTLEEAGFVVREEVHGPRGMTTGIRFTLPNHLRTDKAEPTPEPTPEPSCARSLEDSSYVVIRGTSPSTPKPKPSFSPEFAAFYDRYPRHEGRADAWRAWVKAKGDERAEEIMAGLVRLLPDYRNREPKYVPLPATFLNGERWTDEPDKPPPIRFPTNGRASPAQPDSALAAVQRMARGET